MSEAERNKRLSYKERRKKWIFIQGIALVLVALLILASVLVFNQLNKEIYIEYQESSSVKYSVKIPKDAPFYSDYLQDFAQFADKNGDLWIPSNYAYPTMAATTIKVDLDYQLNMGTPNVDYEYTYRIYAHPEVVDSASKSKFPMPKTMISESSVPVTQNSNNILTISKPVEIDYHHYDEIVKTFESKMGIKNATENLIITMEVEVIGSSEMFENNAENTHTIVVSVPLNESAFDVNYTSSGQGGDCKILARKNSGNQHIFRGAAFVLGGIELVLLIVFIAYVYLTRNHDVNYSIKVQRLVNNYRSFIQQVVNGFDTTGYQMLKISTFKEMLAIRDTIQSPVLMSENTDQTRAQFFIPTNTKILYVFEIKVENYDELYGAHPEWIDDSLIKLEGDSVETAIAEAKEEIAESAALTDAKDESVIVLPPDPETVHQNETIATLYAEIEKLRLELAASQTQKIDPVVKVEPQIVTSPGVVSPVKFGNFTAGGNVTINYNEGPNTDVIKEAALLIANKLGDSSAPKGNSPDENHTHVPTAENVVEIKSTQCDDKFNAIIEDPKDEIVAKTIDESASTSVEEATSSPVNEIFAQLAEEPAAEEPVVEEPAVEEPVAEEPAAEEPAAEEPAAEEPVAEEPVTEEPVAEEPVAEELVAEEPVAEEPTSDKPEINVEEKAEESIEAPEDVVIDATPEAAEQEAAPHAEAHTEHIHVDLEHVLNDLEYDEEHGYFIDEEGNPLRIQCRRSFTANIIQADPETVKSYYSELKNYALSFKGVKARMSWRYETFKKGRDQLVRMKIRGKSICLYCALDPEQFDKNKYFQETVEAGMFEDVPMLVKIKSPRGLKRAFELIDAVMEKFGIKPDPKAEKVDYVAAHPYEKTKALVDRGLVKILDNDYIIDDHEQNAEQPAPTEAVAELPVAAEQYDSILEMAEKTVEMAEELAENAEKLTHSTDELTVDELEFDEQGEIIVPTGKQLEIHCKRSFEANIMQSDPNTVKSYYNDVKNYILSFKGVKSRMAWRYESFKCGRNQLFRIRVKGKALGLYCALDPSQVDESRYFHDVTTSKDYSEVPTMVRIKTARGLGRAKELVDAVMTKYDIQPNPKAKSVDYFEVYPFRKTRDLVKDGYVKVLSDSYKIKEPKAPKLKSVK